MEAGVAAGDAQVLVQGLPIGDDLGVRHCEQRGVVDPDGRQEEVGVLGASDVKRVQLLPIPDDLAGSGVDVAEVRDILGVLFDNLPQVGNGGPALGSGRPRLDHVEHVLLELVFVEVYINERVS